MLADVGGPGQQKLKAARVLVIGAGGLGAPVIQYLAAAGVGTLGIVDDDTVSLSNLQRQVIHDTAAVGRPKVESARDAVARLNPHVAVETHAVRLTAENAGELVGALRHRRRRHATISPPATRSPMPASIREAAGDGGGRPIRRVDHDAEAVCGRRGREPNPTYRCLFPEAPPDGLLPTCAQAGILGALIGVVGSMQAIEVIKEIVGIGEGLVGRLLLYDARAARFETIRYRWNPANPLNGQLPRPRNKRGAAHAEQARATKTNAAHPRPPRRRARQAPSEAAAGPVRRRRRARGLAIGRSFRRSWRG